MAGTAGPGFAEKNVKVMSMKRSDGYQKFFGDLLQLEFVFPVELFEANLALERLLPSVEELVAFHVVGTSEFLAADIALVSVVFRRGTEKD